MRACCCASRTGPVPAIGIRSPVACAVRPAKVRGGRTSLVISGMLASLASCTIAGSGVRGRGAATPPNVPKAKPVASCAMGSPPASTAICEPAAPVPPPTSCAAGCAASASPTAAATGRAEEANVRPRPIAPPAPPTPPAADWMTRSVAVSGSGTPAAVNRLFSASVGVAKSVPRSLFTPSTRGSATMGPRVVSAAPAAAPGGPAAMKPRPAPSAAGAKPRVVAPNTPPAVVSGSAYSLGGISTVSTGIGGAAAPIGRCCCAANAAICSSVALSGPSTSRMLPSGASTS